LKKRRKNPRQEYQPHIKHEAILKKMVNGMSNNSLLISRCSAALIYPCNYLPRNNLLLCSILIGSAAKILAEILVIIKNKFCNSEI
jgi:hypothetical protein